VAAEEPVAEAEAIQEEAEVVAAEEPVAEAEAIQEEAEVVAAEEPVAEALDQRDDSGDTEQTQA
jgi:hypothetical protein